MHHNYNEILLYGRQLKLISAATPSMANIWSKWDSHVPFRWIKNSPKINYVGIFFMIYIKLQKLIYSSNHYMRMGELSMGIYKNCKEGNGWLWKVYLLWFWCFHVFDSIKLLKMYNLNKYPELFITQLTLFIKHKFGSARDMIQLINL